MNYEMRARRRINAIVKRCSEGKYRFYTTSLIRRLPARIEWYIRAGPPPAFRNSRLNIRVLYGNKKDGSNSSVFGGCESGMIRCVLFSKGEGGGDGKPTAPMESRSPGFSNYQRNVQSTNFSEGKETACRHLGTTLVSRSRDQTDDANRPLTDTIVLHNSRKQK